MIKIFTVKIPISVIFQISQSTKLDLSLSLSTSQVDITLAINLIKI